MEIGVRAFRGTLFTCLAAAFGTDSAVFLYVGLSGVSPRVVDFLLDWCSYCETFNIKHFRKPAC